MNKERMREESLDAPQQPARVALYVLALCFALSVLGRGLGVLAGFVKVGLVASNGEARRQIKGGGLRVNDVAVTDEKLVLAPRDLTPDGVIKLSLGKKRHILLKPA